MLLSSFACAAPRLLLEKTSIDLGDIEEGDKFEQAIEIKNTGDSDLYIKAVSPTCDCTTIIEPKKELTLTPSEKSAIRFNFDSTGLEGDFSRHIYVYSNDADAPVQKINIDGHASVVDAKIEQRVERFGLFVIITSGLIDGINPCAFTVLVFFISFLTFSGYKRKQVVQTGLAFILAVFLTYFLIGLGIFRIVQSLEVFRNISDFIRMGTGALALFLGIVSLYDFIVYKISKDPDRIKLKLPEAVKKQIHSVIREKTDIRGKDSTNFKIIIGAFVTGFLVSLLESVCTGQTYLPTIMFMFRIPALKIRALSNLVIYNFMFIVPLIFILAFGIMGVRSEAFGAIARKHMGAVKLAMAFVFFVLGISLFVMK